MLFVQVNLYKVRLAKIWSACHVIEDDCTLPQMLGGGLIPAVLSAGRLAGTWTWRSA
jgi:hypothetical protein